MKFHIKVVTILILVLLFISIAGCDRRFNASVFYGEFCDAERTSYKEVEGLKKSPDKLVWKHDLSEAYEAILFTENAPTIEGNKAYLVSGSVITVVDLETGKELWKKDYLDSDFDSAFFDSPVIYNNKIVIVGGYPAHRFLLVIDKNTGTPVWRSKTIGGTYAEECSSHPLIINGLAYLAATSKESYDKYGDVKSGIYVWDINKGKFLHRISFDKIAEPIVGKYRPISPALTSLAQDGTKIYGVTEFRNHSANRTYIFCYDIVKNKFTWFAPVGGKNLTSPAQMTHIAVNKNFVAISMVGNQWMGKEPQFFIEVFDKTSHKLLWQNLSKTIRKSQPILSIGDFAIHNDKLYAMLFDKRFVCFNMKTGKEIWSFKDAAWKSKWWNNWNGYKNCFLEHDVVVAKDTAYFNVCNAIYALDPNSGKLIWRKIVKKGNIFINIMPVDNGLIVRYQDIKIGHDFPQNPVISLLWR